MHTAPGVCLLYASGAVCFSNMALDHIYLKTFLKIINGLYGRGQNSQKTRGYWERDK